MSDTFNDTTVVKKGLPADRTSKILYYNRSCSKCIHAPCFVGFENMKTDFAIAGSLITSSIVW